MSEGVRRPGATQALFAAIGLCQGLVFLAAREYWPSDGGPATALVVAPAIAAGVAGLCLQLSWAGRATGRWVAVALALAGLFGGLTYWVMAQLDPAGADFAGDESRLFSFWPAAVVALYVLGPYLQIFVDSGRFRFPYVELFFHAWNNALIALFGVAYDLVFALVVWLTSGLFSMIQIGVVAQVTGSPRFWLLALPVLFGLGVATGSESARMIDALRTALLAVFRLLLPLFAVVALAFLLALPFTGLAPIWATGYAAPLLLSTLVAGILFANAELDDGERARASRNARGALLALTVLVLPAFAGLALYSLGLRIAQHGLTPERFLGVVIACVLGAYALAYALGVPLRGWRWPQVARAANVVLSGVVVGAAVLLHTPLLDPVRWSVRNQVGRLLRGAVSPEQFDFAHLRLERGRLGHAALDELRTLQDHPQLAAIREGVERAFATDAKTRGPRFNAESLKPIGGLAEVPPGLVAAASLVLRDFERRRCAERGDCAVFAAPLGGEEAHYCLIAADSARALCFARSGESFRFVATLGAAPSENDCGERCDLRRLLREGPVEAAEPVRPDLRISGQRFQLQRDGRGIGYD